ncbi:hypothetical protein [Mycolicibacterium sp.]|uniref:hypothetical protein n=1 Tax=Mycolicibacterium sp. TaxID=2320850 RepID=UPI003D0DEA53
MKVSRAVLAVAAIGAGAVIATAPTAPANPYLPEPTEDSAEFAIADGYIVKQTGCTPELSPAFESVVWDPPGFTPEGGTGMIIDANPALGGAFAVRWAGDHWDVEYQFC